MLSVKINGSYYPFSEGMTILQCLKDAGIYVPTLCHDERLKPLGGCRLCAVQVDGKEKPVMACTTELSEGMVIQTQTPELVEHRRHLLRLLAQRYPEESYHRYPDHPFHELLHQYDVTGDLTTLKDSNLIDDCHPYIHVDMSRCIDCYRCVRICDELQGQFVWNVWNRGDTTQVRAGSGESLLGSACVSCGACVDTCPTGALDDQSLRAGVMPERWTRTTCSYCGTGCEMDVGTYGSEIVTIRPVLEGPVGQGHLCVKGRYSFEFVKAADRITKPMIRMSDGWKDVSWAEAIHFASTRLKETMERFGPDSIGVLGSARATNEDNYLTQKFARVVLSTNNVDCCARVCHAPTAAGMKQILGTGAATNSFDDIEKAHAILLCGANATENHPVVGARIKQAARNGTRLIVIDPRTIELSQFADVHLQIRPGTNIPLLNSLAHVILSENLTDEQFLTDRVTGFQEFRQAVAEWSPERAAKICGCDADLIRKAARIYAQQKPALIIHGLGVTEHIQGTDGVMCLVNLALLTGNIGIAGGGINPLRGQNNVQGSAHMGCDPNHLTGYVPLEKGRENFESIWRSPVPLRNGLNLMQMMDSAVAGDLKGLWAIGYDIHLTNPFAHFTRKALANLDFVIVQDLFLNETARDFGSIFFPVCSSFEKDGTFMNAERRIQPVRKVMDPVGDSKPDWKVICEVAEAMGKREFFSYESAKEIWDEIRVVWKAGSGVTYDRLNAGGLQWPCPSEEHPGTAVLHQEEFSGRKTAKLECIDYHPADESVDGTYPYLLITGRTLYHFNAGTMTNRTRNTELQATDFLDIHPQDAERLNIVDREEVRLCSRYGEAILPARMNDSVHPGQLFATFHNPQIFLNRVTGPHRDCFTQTPEYKITAVRIEKL